MKALFVSRHNNDYDSLAPVADGWVDMAPGNQAIFYFPTPEIRWRNDFRTAMLRQRGRIAFTDLWDVSGSGASGRWLAAMWAGVDANRRIRRKALQFLTEPVVAPRFAAGLRALLDCESPDIIAFDWYSPPARRARFSYFGYQEILAWARARNVPVVSLPHGLVLYDRPQERAARMGAYHTLFVESGERKATLQRLGGELPEIFVAGSPRYDPRWVDKVARQLNAAGPAGPAGSAGGEGDPDTLNVVYFGKKQVYEFDFASQNAWLAHLAAHPRVRLTIQPHPRGQKDRAFAALAGLPNVTIDARTPASALITRARMVSTLTSSVMVEAVVRGREILYPKFFNTVVTRFEEKGACVTLESMEDTYPAIDRYLAGERVPRQNYEAFLKETAFGGDGPNTIERICARLTQIAGNAPAR